MQGIWSGYVIKVQKNNKKYELHTTDGVRGVNISVSVEYIDNIWYASHNGRKLTILKVCELQPGEITSVEKLKENKTITKVICPDCKGDGYKKDYYMEESFPCPICLGDKILKFITTEYYERI